MGHQKHNCYFQDHYGFVHLWIERWKRNQKREEKEGKKSEKCTGNAGPASKWLFSSKQNQSKSTHIWEMSESQHSTREMLLKRESFTNMVPDQLVSERFVGDSLKHEYLLIIKFKSIRLMQLWKV